MFSKKLAMKNKHKKKELLKKEITTEIKVRWKNGELSDLTSWVKYRSITYRNWN